MSNWTRGELKDRAKAVLRVNYWIAFVVALILSVALGAGTGGAGSGSRYTFSKNDNVFEKNYYYHDEDFEFEGIDEFGEFYGEMNFPGRNLFLGMAAIVASFATLFSLALSIFLLNPLIVGGRNFFLTSGRNPHNDMGYLGVAFKNGNYWSVVKGMFLKNLYNFLWTLLFIIPGIVKAYSYRMVPYILAENPHMDANEAITLSRKMMNGEKFDAFVLDLSFIGWYLLGMLAFCIGGLFVNPYKYSTDAQLYLVLKNKAVSQGYMTSDVADTII